MTRVWGERCDREAGSLGLNSLRDHNFTNTTLMLLPLNYFDRDYLSQIILIDRTDLRCYCSEGTCAVTAAKWLLGAKAYKGELLHVDPISATL